ncbi:BTAD domain-containing putative transcriptional regulator [Longispora sp. K20-0274]|uniref:AfsR/SARP family transcriptional regulator n=1 Tax=Longispora sp. K20-0274 TaxID=3088255 RepID=UPI003999DAF9
MEFRVLGGVDVLVDGLPVDLGRRRMERCLLGLLLLNLNAALSIDRMIDLLWGEDAPASARAALHVHVSRLRTGLAAVDAERRGFRLVTRSGGYALEGDPSRVDAHRFRDLCRRGHEATGPAVRRSLLGPALELWRGRPLGELCTPRIRSAYGRGLEELHLSATELRIEADLALGGHQGVLPELERLARLHPLRERLVELHLLALYRAGRRADALAVYERARRLLVDATGLDPRAELDELYQRILRRDPTLDPVRVPVPRTVPAQLPPDEPGFAGRREELEFLDGLLPGPGQAGPPSVVISGERAVGKTALAVHWAHRVRSRFPDGQLFLDLSAPTAGPEPTTALHRLLTGLGVAGDALPDGVDEAVDLYRSLVGDRRVLLVLDNATHPDQVRPLLPSNPGSLTVIASRDRLSSLIALNGATRLLLGPL